MKKTIGFIFTLMLVVLFANVASVKAESYLVGEKDYYKELSKKYSKKAKKKKKTSKKSKKSKKENLGTVKVISASSYFTNKVDLSKINYQDALLSVIRQKDGYLGIPGFLKKFKDDSNYISVSIMSEDSTTTLVEYGFKDVCIGLIDSSNFSCVSLVNDVYDKDTLINILSDIGVKLSFSQKLFSDMIRNDRAYTIKLGNADWIIGSKSSGIYLERIVAPIKITDRDVLRAITYGRLNLTPTFYEKFLTLVNKTDVIPDNHDKFLCFNGLIGDFGVEYTGIPNLVDTLNYYDDKEYKETKLRIGGCLESDDEAEELSSVLKNYCGIDFNESDKSRLRKLIGEDSILFEPFEYKKDYGKNSLEVTVFYEYIKGIVYMINVTVHND